MSYGIGDAEEDVQAGAKGSYPAAVHAGLQPGRDLLQAAEAAAANGAGTAKVRPIPAHHYRPLTDEMI